MIVSCTFCKYVIQMYTSRSIGRIVVTHIRLFLLSAFYVYSMIYVSECVISYSA